MSERAAGAAELVVVADDDESVAQLIAELLEAAGYEAAVVHDGLAALTHAAGRGVAAVVLDVSLPLISGYQVCDALRRTHGRSLPIIFVSGERTESLDRVAGLLMGADDYLVKPFDPDELLARIRTLLDRRAAGEKAPRHLTDRELEVLTLLAEGLDQEEIAGRLVISTKTVSTHIEHILGKLGVRSRAQAVAVAYRESLVS